MEEGILGAIMLERDAIDMACSILRPEAFYQDTHQRIFRVMMEFSNRNAPIDVTTVIQGMRDKGELELVGGAYYITRLTNDVVSTANIETYCRVVLQKFMQRELIRISADIFNTAFANQGDVFEMLDYAEQQLTGITKEIHADVTDMNSALMDAMKRVEKFRAMDKMITGVPSGFPSMDAVTRGWQPTDLIILAARPSVGKTAMALNLARNACAEGFPVAFFSLEMSTWQLVFRIIAAESMVNLQRLQTGSLDTQEMEQLYRQGLDHLSKMNMYFDDTAALSLATLRYKARRLRRKNKIEMIVIDYLQLMSGTGNNREQEISSISRGLKALAKELGIPIIALSQLSREIERRGGGKREPILADLRESGAIEQDADMVMFLWGPSEDEIAADATLEGRRHWRIAKARNGLLHRMMLDFTGEIQRFREYTDAVKGLPGSGYRPLALSF